MELREQTRDCLQDFYLDFLEKGLKQPFVQKYDPARAEKTRRQGSRNRADLDSAVDVANPSGLERPVTTPESMTLADSANPTTPAGKPNSIDPVRAFSNFFLGHPRHSPLMRFVRDWARKHRRPQLRRRQPDLDDTEDITLRIVDPSPGPEKDAAYDELIRLIQEFLETENPRARMIFALHDLKGLSYAEVCSWHAGASGHDISEVNARVIAHGVRQRLRAFLTAMGYKPRGYKQ
ncbi:MAG: sigma-70 family RNA polymerase sigma factor [Candidatus Eisenbacteria sp.]|nr:sigma-70 family RNA polymerase sigma factor [Candidatus Eisenbacteria bacterium]